MDLSFFVLFVVQVQDIVVLGIAIVWRVLSLCETGVKIKFQRLNIVFRTSEHHAAQSQLFGHHDDGIHQYLADSIALFARTHLKLVNINNLQTYFFQQPE